jgi:type IV pilus assembly protein PilA
MNTQRLRNYLARLNRDDSGFTLVEVLTITVIIGILSAIAIPTLKAQASKGQGATAASDLRNAATSMESYLADPDHGTYGAASDLAGDQLTPSLSAGSTVVIVQHNDAAYCMALLRNTPVPTSFGGLQSTALRWFDSAAGGLQPVGTKSCPTTSAVASDWSTDIMSGPPSR